MSLPRKASSAAAHAVFPLRARRWLVERAPDLDQATALVAGRLARRRERFLALVARAVYDHPRSPYLPLLREAGVEYRTLEGWVERLDVEGALERLRERGVFVPYEEFKAVATGGAAVERLGRDASFANPLQGGGLPVRSSGSRSAGTVVTLDFGRHRANAPHRRLIEAMYGLEGGARAEYYPILPIPNAFSSMLMANYLGTPIEAWFTPLDPRRSMLRHRLATAYLLVGLRAVGGRVARPRFVPLERAQEVARWIEGRRRRGRACLLRSTATSVVRVCEAARASGLDVAGARFQMTGEPVTRSKHDAVRAVGGVPIVSYGSVDAGRMGFSCPSSDGPDDLHLMTDTHAFVRHRRSLERFGVEIEPLLVSTLSEDAPLVLLNVELDDYGELEERPCDCRWGKLGLTRRISNVRSFVKLTADGTTLVGTRLLELLESELPSRFGGGPTHYQLVEEERGSRTELVLRVDPFVGPIEDAAALALVYRRIREQDGAGRISSDLWHAAGAVRIARVAPIVTAGGKQLPIVPLRPQ